MTPPALPLERCSELVAAYGARLELWPVDEAARARELLAVSAEARALFDAEAELDRELAAVSAPPEVPARLLRRLNEVPVRAPQRRVFWPFGRAWMPALGWAFAAALGVSWGLFAPPLEANESDSGAAMVSTASSAGDVAPAAAEDDVAALARGTLVDFEE